MIKRGVLLLSFAFSFQLSQGQLRDSLWKIWSCKKCEPLKRLNALDALAYEFYGDDIDSSLSLAKLEITYAKKVGSTYWLMKGMISSAGALYDMRKLKESLKQYESCLVLAKKQKSKKLQIPCLNGISNIYADYGDNIRATKLLRQSLRISDELNDSTWISACYFNLSLLYNTQGELDLAIDFIRKAISIDEKLGGEKTISESLVLLANLFDAKRSYTESMAIYRRSLRIALELKDSSVISLVYNDMGVSFKKREEYDTALYYYFKALDLRKKFGNKQEIAGTSLNMANLFLIKKDLKKAREYGELGLAYAKESEYLEWIVTAYNLLHEVYREYNEYDLSLLMLENYVKLNDSLINADSQNEMIRQEFKYNYEKQALADSVKQSEERKINNSVLAREKTMKGALIFGLSLTFLFAIFMFNRFRVAKKQKKLIETQKSIVEEQKLLVEEKQKEIIDSIHYAKRIQLALLPNVKQIQKILKNIKSN